MSRELACKCVCFDYMANTDEPLMTVKVDPTTVASDSFMLNLQAVLLRFAEPFMDANYTKV